MENDKTVNAGSIAAHATRGQKATTRVEAVFEEIMSQGIDGGQTTASRMACAIVMEDMFKELAEKAESDSIAFTSRTVDTAKGKKA